MASLRLELEGKDREVHELAGNVRTLQEQLEQVSLHSPETMLDETLTLRCVQAQATREVPQPTVEAQLEAVRERMDYDAVMQERQTFREQVSTVLGTELRTKCDLQMSTPAGRMAEGE